MQALHYIITVGMLLSTAGGLQAAPGDIVTSIPSPGATPLGMAFDGECFWIADRMTDRLYRIAPADGAVVDSLDAPEYDPRGVAWDGTLLWCVDGGSRVLYGIDPSSRTVVRTIPSPVLNPTGLAWDGTHFWLADDGQNRLLRLNAKTGGVERTLPAPSFTPCGLTFDGRYLWVSDRGNDEIYMVSPDQGDVIITLRSPGPHPWGLVSDGESLWSVDYQTDRIYELVVDDNTPVLRYDGKMEMVEYVHRVRNAGPDTLITLNVNMAVPGNLVTQELLDSVRFFPAPAAFGSDQWGQRVARWEYLNVAPGGATDIRMAVPARIFKTRYFVFPEKVGTISQVPPEIRAQYLGDDAKFSMTDPVMQAALLEAVGDEQNPYWIGRKIYNYLIDRLEYELEGGWSVAPAVLARGTGSCSEYSFVYISLCRAAGVPARFAGSVVIRGDDASFDNIFHRWVEIYLPNYGWIPVDPSGGDSPWPAARADNFGFLDNRYLITTLGGGGSEFLDWSYNSHEWWTAKRRCNVTVESFAEWSPVAISEPEGEQ